MKHKTVLAALAFVVALGVGTASAADPPTKPCKPIGDTPWPVPNIVLLPPRPCPTDTPSPSATPEATELDQADPLLPDLFEF